VASADVAEGLVRMEFAPQPAFGNHFGDIQGGFVVAMLDVPLSLATYLVTGEFLPTAEIKTSFLAPARIGPCAAEGSRPARRAHPRLHRSQALVRRRYTRRPRHRHRRPRRTGGLKRNDEAVQFGNGG